MKILSLTQPWATLMAIGQKRIESRSWRTSYCGELAIHAAKGVAPIGGKRAFLDLCLSEPFHSVLSAHMQSLKVHTLDAYLAELSFGGIVCVVDLYACKSTNGEYGSLPAPWVDGLSEQERAFGNYDPNRYGWWTENLRRLREPVACRGAQGLRDLPAEIEALVREQM